MPRRLALDLARAAAALARAREAIAPARRDLDALVSVIEAARADIARVHDAGLALELIRRKKLYRLRGHTTLAAFLAEIGLSRTTAYKWRAIATRLDAAEVAELGLERAYARVRPESTHRGTDDAEALAARLAAFGVDAKVVPVLREREIHLRVELPVDDWPRVLAKPRVRGAR